MKSLEQNLSEIHQKAERLIEKKERKLKALKTACLISAVSVCFALLTLAGFAAAAKLRRQHEKNPDDITDDEYAVIDKMLFIGSLADRYDPVSADPVS